MSTRPRNWAGMSAVQARPCLCSRKLSKTLVTGWLMTVCVHPPPPFPVHSFLRPRFRPSLLLSIFSQQQIFIWWFTRGLCSPGCQQPTSFSAASRWFPGCILPRFPPVEAAKNCSHTLSCVQCTTSKQKKKTPPKNRWSGTWLQQSHGVLDLHTRRFLSSVLYVGFFSVIDVKQEVVVHKYLCISYLKNKRVVLVRHLQRHGGPDLHNGW